MKFYTIYPSKSVSRDFSFELKGNQEKIIDYFKFDDVSNGFLKKPRINLTYDDDFSSSLNEILNSDFYYSSSGVLLFSKRFYDELKIELSSECEFYNCLVNNLDSDIYALYIKNKFKFLDDCERIIRDIRFDSDYILKDKIKPYVYIVTDNFVKIVKEHNFKMQFLEFC